MTRRPQRQCFGYGANSWASTAAISDGNAQVLPLLPAAARTATRARQRGMLQKGET